MTALMKSIFEYITDYRYQNYLPQPTYQNYFNLLVEQEQALLDTCSAEQKEMLDACQTTFGEITCMELEAMFQASWAVARELR